MAEDGEPVVTERKIDCHYMETVGTEGTINWLKLLFTEKQV